jgi:hypothetical protein
METPQPEQQECFTSKINLPPEWHFSPFCQIQLNRRENTCTCPTREPGQFRALGFTLARDSYL